MQSQETNLITLPPAERALIVLDSSAAERDLRAMVERTSAITNVVDSNGRKEAHAAAMAIKGARVDIEKKGEDARKDANAFSKAVIAEARRLAEIVEPEEDRLIGLRNDFDAKVAAEKAEKERIEGMRKFAIQEKIHAITSLAVKHAGASATELHYVLSELAQRVITEEEFAEFSVDAQAALDTTAHALLTLRSAAQEREAEEAERQLAAEAARKQAEADRLELEKLRAQQAEDARIRADESARIEQERAAERAAAAVIEKQLADMKAALAAAEEEKRQKAEAAEKLERDHAEALHMDACYQPRDVLRVTIEAPAAIEQSDIIKVIQPSKRPSDLDMVEVLAKHYEVPADVALDWVEGIDVQGVAKALAFLD